MTTREELHAQVDRDGSYHKVDNRIIMDKMEKLREQYIALGHTLVDVLPVGREQSLALTHLLDQSLPMAIGSLARDQDQILKELFGDMEVKQ